MAWERKIGKKKQKAFIDLFREAHQTNQMRLGGTIDEQGKERIPADEAMEDLRRGRDQDKGPEV